MQIAPPRHWGSASAPHGDASSPADDYLVATRNASTTMLQRKDYEYHHHPDILRLVTEAPLHLDGRQRAALPPPRTVPMSLSAAFEQRASGRDFGHRPLAAEDLATLLFLGNGTRPTPNHAAPGTYRRNAANAGSLGSVELFPIALNVAGVAPGIYHFDSVRHDLARLHDGQFRAWLGERVLHQAEFADASVALVLTCAFGRLRAKYGERGLRLGFLDAGHVSENIYLVGGALGLRICATAGFVDAALDTALDLDGLALAPVLVLLIGNAPERSG